MKRILLAAALCLLVAAPAMAKDKPADPKAACQEQCAKEKAANMDACVKKCMEAKPKKEEKKQ